jgi:DNA polymerase III, gamma/tau subunits
METLANKWRPQEFSDVIGQNVNTTILSTQIENKSYSHAMLFAGNAGCGKTTCAKIFANKIDGEIFELDCSKNNGVADIAHIIEIAEAAPIVHTYKVFILDECHVLSSQAWPTLLITLEKSIPHSIFILCTTDTQKIPATIISRVQRYNFVPISDKLIENRLHYICNEENISIEDEAISIIAHNSKNCMRQALTDLDKCMLYGELNATNIRKVLNIISDNILEYVYEAVVNNNNEQIISLINNLYNEGYELHLFIKTFLDYCLNNLKDIHIIDTILTINQDIKYDASPKSIIIARLLTWNINKEN